MFHRGENRWEEFPARDDAAALHDVAIACDGSVTWVALNSDENPKLKVQQRSKGHADWLTIKASMPSDYDVGEKLWLTPDNRELWVVASGCGLLRVKLSDGSVSQYAKSDFRKFDRVEQFSLVEDYVEDLTFAAKGEIAVCAATGGGEYGITLIDRVTGESSDVPVTDAVTFEKLVVAPDDRTVWCIGNNSFLWACDVRAKRWTHRFSSDHELPIHDTRVLRCSADGNLVWIRGWSGTAVYSVKRKKWQGFVEGPWWVDNVYTFEEPPLEISWDGKYVLTSHEQGLAIFAADGSSHKVVRPPRLEECRLSHLVPIPNSADFVCAFHDAKAGVSLYRLDVGSRQFQKLMDLDQPITALAMPTSRSLWTAVPGTIFELEAGMGTVVRKHSFAR